MLCLKFDNPIKLGHLIKVFQVQYKHNNLDCSLVIIEYRECFRGQLTLEYDYVISMSNIE